MHSCTIRYNWKSICIIYFDVLFAVWVVEAVPIYHMKLPRNQDNTKLLELLYMTL